MYFQGSRYTSSTVYGLVATITESQEREDGIKKLLNSEPFYLFITQVKQLSKQLILRWENSALLFFPLRRSDPALDIFSKRVQLLDICGPTMIEAGIVER